MIGDVTGEREFSTADHLLVLRKERLDEKNPGWYQRGQTQGTSQGPQSNRTPYYSTHQKTGSWMTVQGSIVTGTLLVDAWFRNFLYAYYDVTPPLPPRKCDEWSLSFYVHHGLRCINRGLVIAHNIKVRGELLYIARRAFTLNCVCGSYIRGGATWRQEVTFSSKAYGKAILTPSPTSYLEMLTRIYTSMIQRKSSWLVGRRKIIISKVRTTTSNGRFFSVFPISGWNAQEGGSSHTWEFELTHWEKYRGTHFTRTWLVQRTDQNHGHAVVLPNDMCSLPY